MRASRQDRGDNRPPTRWSALLVLLWLAVAAEASFAQTDWAAAADRANRQAVQQWMADELEIAVATYGRAAEAFRKAGDPRMQGHCTTNRGMLLRKLGREEEADAEYERAVEILGQYLGTLEKGGSEYLMVLRNYWMAMGGILEREIRLRRLDSARRIAEEQLQRVLELNDENQAGTAWAYENLGQIAALSGDFDEARRHYSESARLWDESGAPDSGQRVRAELASLGSGPPGPEPPVESPVMEEPAAEPAPPPIRVEVEPEPPSVPAVSRPEAVEPPAAAPVPDEPGPEPVEGGRSGWLYVVFAAVGLFLVVGVLELVSTLAARAREVMRDGGGPSPTERSETETVERSRGAGCSGCFFLLLVLAAVFYFVRFN